MSEYQRQYRLNNLEKARKYQKEYRLNPEKFSKTKNTEETVTVDRNRGRIYICMVGDFRLKIGATHVGSKRIYNLKRRLKQIGISLTPLYFFDFNDRNLTSEIEMELKNNFCSPEVGIKLNSFMYEMSNYSNLEKIINFIENRLRHSNLEYEIIKCEK